MRWGSVDHPDLAGYRIYFSQDGSFSEQDRVELGPVTQATISVDDCTEYRFAVKAYTSSGLESPDFSNVVTGWARPQLSSVAPASLQQNATVDILLEGANFQAGGALLFDDPSITVQSLSVDGCNRISARLQIGANATVGASTFRVINPDQVFGEATGLLLITTDSTGPAITQVGTDAIGATTATIGWTTDEPASSEVFFRRVGQSQFRRSVASATPTTDHQLELFGLEPETAYQYYVVSADGDDNSSQSNIQTAFVTGASAFHYLRLEAEAAALSAPIQAFNGAAFQNSWIALPAGASGGSIDQPSGLGTLGFELPEAGSWSVWLRLFAPNGTARGWFERVDDEAFAETATQQTGGWEWVLARTYPLSAGLHRLELGGADPNARLDRVLITDDPGFVPSEVPLDDTDAPAAVGQLTAEAGFEQISLSWRMPPDADVARVVVRFRTDGISPTNPNDGTSLLDAPAGPNQQRVIDHEGLSGETVYSYAVFAIDVEGNVSEPATAQLSPLTESPPATVQNLERADTQ